MEAGLAERADGAALEDLTELGVLLLDGASLRLALALDLVLQDIRDVLRKGRPAFFASPVTDGICARNAELRCNLLVGEPAGQPQPPGLSADLQRIFVCQRGSLHGGNGWETF